jgi:hypothetical protein
LIFCRKGRQSIVISYAPARMNLEHLEAIALEVHVVIHSIFSVHSVQLGPSMR